MKILEGSGFDEVTLEIDGLKLTMRRGASGSDGSAPASATSLRSTTSLSSTKPDAATDPSLQDVTSPLLGTCYRAPKPGAPPFVEVGTPVEEGTVVAIVEVMKLMNTVRAGAKGTVAEILMRDGELVEYGETLLRVKKAG
jgi:acetyl-CoA carboxylase biotin carboxyl carrier protein